MKSITGKYSVCGVIGDPIEHTLSPSIHNTIAEVVGEPMVYVPYHVREGHLESAIKGAYALGIKGLNVTMPHKKEVMQYLYQIDQVAQEAQAVNTLVYTEEGYKGYNTDIEGLRLAMIRNGINWKDKRVAIIGSGGAAYAACLCVIQEVKALVIYNRTRDNAMKLRDHLHRFYETPITVCEMEEKVESVDLVIQTTGVGMGSYKDEMPLCTKHIVEGASVAVDLIYHPWESKFLGYAKEKGLQVMNGFDMLYYQAVEAYEKMHGYQLHEADKNKIRNQVIRELEWSAK